MRHLAFPAFFAFAALLAGCATTPPPAAPGRGPSTTAAQPQPEPPLRLIPARWSDLPGWTTADHRPALDAFKRSCAPLARRADGDKLGRQALYGGTVSEWRLACAAAASAADPKTFFETYFQPSEVLAPADAMRKVTGYYEPVIDVRAAPAPGIDEPFLARPANLVSVDLFAFDEATGLSEDIASDVVKALPDQFAAARGAIEPVLDERIERRFRTPAWGLLSSDRRVGPMPPRSGIDLAAGTLAFARPCDVYDVQVQGSARVRFEDGRDMRMAYAAQNGYGWNSVYSGLRERGAITSPTKQSVCAWMATASPAQVREAMNYDPSYVFFSLEPVGDPNAGPRGAQGVPLTPLGSVAVDPSAHPYGALLFIDGGAAPVGQRLMVAQDTGGAIRRGPLRADVFFGTGAEAGAVAQGQNAPGRFWTLLPIQFAPSPPVAQAETERRPG